MKERLKQLNQWLTQLFGTDRYHIEIASADASFRLYYRVSHQEKSLIVMDAPPAQEDCQSFVDIAQRLHVAQINVPQIIAQDIEAGFLLMTDLGDTLYLDIINEENANALYTDAITTLVTMQQRTNINGLPSYDAKQLYAEMGLFRHWLLHIHLGIQLSQQENKILDEVFYILANEALIQPLTFVHRDYHSRNLLVSEANNPSMLDFQDAVVGAFTYDLVSLLKDCYIKWPKFCINGWAMMFYQQINSQYADIDEQQFMRYFDFMGIQRHLKASGIFARLYHRDGKIGYLSDIPRTLSYIIDIQEDYPQLTDFVGFIKDRVIPLLSEKEICVP